MRHRKKLLFATLLLIAAYTTWCFWPHSNPQAVQALATLRGMVEFDETAKAPPMPDIKPSGDVQIELRVMMATINMTDATAGLFAEPGRISDKTVIGRLRSNRGFLEILQSRIAETQFNSMPRLILMPGQRASLTVGGSTAVIAPAPPGGAGGPPTLSYRNVGTTVNIVAQMMPGGFVVDLEGELSQTGRSKTVATAQGSQEIPDIHVLAARARAAVKTGETLVIGGISQKRPDRSRVELPILSEIPGIGSWFGFARQREIEEELVILVTPRIVPFDSEVPGRAPRLAGRQ